VGGRPPGTAYHGHRHNASGAWSPEVNIRETDQGITLLVALPGVEKEDVQLEVKADTLILSGRSRMALDGNGWLSAEIPGGEFYRAFSLPAAVKPGEVKATCKSGILSIELPKTEEARPRKVQIG